MANNNHNDDHVQHGIDDNPSGDAEKGAALGGLGGVAVGAAAGSMAGPVGTVIGAVVGGVSGALASGAAVAAVDAVDNDDTVSGVGDGHTTDLSGAHSSDAHGSSLHQTSAAPLTATSPMGGSVPSSDYETGTYAAGQAHSTDESGHNVVTGGEAQTDAGKTGLASGAVVGGLVGTAVGGPVGAVVGGTLGSLAGGVAGDASEAVDEIDPATGQNRAAGHAVGTDPDLSASSDAQSGGRVL